jgi:DNA (cytosine-5)-methyltransferase 1
MSDGRLKTVCDLFCGAGGLSLGLKDAGFQVVDAIDNVPAAVETYARNVGGEVRKESITSDTDIPSVDVITGGPPCQGFSSAGLQRKGDHRNTLVEVFSGLVAHVKPAAFIFENVEGFLTTEGGTRVLDLLSPLIRTGYRIHLRKVNAANFGVPQHRKRVIAIGGLGWSPPFPEATHSAFGAPGAHLYGKGLPIATTLGEALDGLPPAVSNGTRSTVSDHQYRPLSGSDLERALRLLPGQRMRDLPEAFWHDSYKRRAFRRVMDGTPSERRGGAPAGVRRLAADEPSKAITSGARTEFLHPTEHRALTLRECARLQTFADSFEFAGTQAERATLIGNAVPPRLAAHLAKSLRAAMDNRALFEQGDGALLSFVPTLSEGMSPALQATTELVKRTFSADPIGRQLALWH